MIAALRSTWVLFVGIGFIMVGNGLQASLIGVRAGLEGFPTVLTGLIMSGYFSGFLLGSFVVPLLIKQVGHVRVFAAMASLASVAVLVHAAAVEPWTWFAMRNLTGFATIGLYIVSESWLNDKSSNESRGRVLSLYMIVLLSGMAAGQLLLNLADPEGFLLFILASVLVSLALVPMLLAASSAPEFATPSRLSLRQLYRQSPLAVVACAGVGLAQSALWGLAAVYAKDADYTIPQITIFGAAIFIGAILFQWPLGSLSDRLDRRSVLTAVMLVAALLALLAGAFGPLPFWSDFAAIFLIGGLLMPAYSMVVAYLNDWLEPRQMVAASAGLSFVYGAGASLGPLAASGVMSLLGSQGYYFSLAAFSAAVGVFALYRMLRRPAVPLQQQSPSFAVTSQASPLATELAAEVLLEEGDGEEPAPAQSTVTPSAR
ncbi:MAG: MFS transporter [Kiloniellales bacterium]